MRVFPPRHEKMDGRTPCGKSLPDPEVDDRWARSSHRTRSWNRRYLESNWIVPWHMLAARLDRNWNLAWFQRRTLSRRFLAWVLSLHIAEQGPSHLLRFGTFRESFSCRPEDFCWIEISPKRCCQGPKFGCSAVAAWVVGRQFDLLRRCEGRRSDYLSGHHRSLYRRLYK